MINHKGMALAAALMLGATPALAEDAAAEPTPEFTVTGGVTGVSQYRFRGVSLSDEEPALQGTLNLNHQSGFYAGTWASSLAGWGSYPSSTDPLVEGEADIEVDLYAGYGFEVAPGIKLDAGVLYYWYPGVDNLDTDFFEPYASITGAIGPVSIKVGGAFAPSQKAIGDESNLYLYVDPSVGIPGTPVTLKAHLGRSMGDSFLTFGTATPGGGLKGSNYWDWMIGADAKVFGPLSIGVSYVGTSLDRSDVYGSRYLRDQVDNAIVFSIGASF